MPKVRSQPKYRKNREHRSFLRALNYYFENDWHKFERKVVDRLNEMFSVNEIGLDQILEICGDFNLGKDKKLRTKIIEHWELNELVK